MQVGERNLGRRDQVEVAIAGRRLEEIAYWLAAWSGQPFWPSEGTVWLWRVTDGSLVGTLEDHAGLGISALAFSPDVQGYQPSPVQDEVWNTISIG